MTIAVHDVGKEPQKPVARSNAKPPYFDSQALRIELTKIANETEESDHGRQAVLARLKNILARARECAQSQLELDGNGRACASGLSLFQDELIRLIYDFAVTHIYRATNPSDAERMTIVATGGYGRGLLAPGSDIDLLFLLPYRQTPWGESVAEFILYLLWDLGFKVGHATRTVEQCAKYGLSDSTIRTSLLDIRNIHGDAQLFADLKKRLESDVTRGTSRQFIEAKMNERDERHRRSGESRYRVEPNIKDGKGGLRDLHTLHWLAKYLYGSDLATTTADDRVFTSDELATYRRCEDFLWTIRCHLHFLTKRAEERLSFDVQPAMAEQLDYRTAEGALAVERFMKHYFLIAKDVGDLTTILCSALEMQELMSAPRLDQLINPMTWANRRKIRRNTDFKVDNDRLNVAGADVFKRNPSNLIRIFSVAEEAGLFLHPSALRLIRKSLRLIDDKLRADKSANRMFVELIEKADTPETTLRHMSEAGVLGRFVPEFGQVIAMMQFNMYHHYTVDEHLVRTVGQLKGIEDGNFSDILPLSTEIVPSIVNRRALYIAAFLHDIGKGRNEDHSILGARIARKLCPRFGLSAQETALVAWLIEEHLTMSNIAQSRDIADPKTIRDFVAIVQSPERLKLLLLLTVADIRAVGPDTWNGWKGQLLRQLYWETEPWVSGGHTRVSRQDRIAAAHTALRAELSDWPAAEVDQFIERHYDNYWLRTETRKQAHDAQLMKRAENENLKLATTFESDAFNAMTELSVLAPNHPRLLSLFAGCTAVAGGNIIDAHISTTRDGLALDTFLLARQFENDEDEERSVGRIIRTIDTVLKGESRLARLMGARKPVETRISAFSVEPDVVINNSLSDNFTVIEASGLDRPGLLYELTAAIADLSLDITSAHITTYGEKVVDVFYVTDLTGNKITSDRRQKDIREKMTGVLQRTDKEQ